MLKLNEIVNHKKKLQAIIGEYKISFMFVSGKPISTSPYFLF